MSDALSVTIDGRVLAGRKGETILALAERSGIDIPALCLERRLDPYDSCGVCAVEVEGTGVVRACSTPIKEGMVAATASPAAQDVRRTALELLLSNHFGDCVGPCQIGCPAHTDCQGYVSLAANGLFLDGLKLLYEKLPFPASFGRICPAPCEDACRRQIADEPIQIRHMKRFLGDRGFDYVPPTGPETGLRVAVVGGGPAGCTAGYFLRRLGHAVTLVDAMPKMGGMLRYGIPDFRLPQEVLDRELGVLVRMGIEFRNGVRLGRDVHLADLERDYDAVFLGLGAWASRVLSVPNEAHPAVEQGIDFLRRLSLGEAVTLPRQVAIVGGGNTAIDAARSARRLGADVILIYRRGRDEMPAIPREVDEAEEEGVVLRFLTQPVEFLVEGKELVGIRCVQMRLGEPDASGRARPVPVPGSEAVVPAGRAILALGQAFDPSCLAESGLRFDRQGTILANAETGRTDRPKVFAGGDAVSGPGIAIEAVAAGRRAADAIDRLLRGKPVRAPRAYAHEKRDVTRADLGDVKTAPRVATAVRAGLERARDFREYTTGFTDAQAREEGQRCLGCGCPSGFDCALRDYSAAAGASQDVLAGEVERKRPDERHPFIVRDKGKCIACGRCLRVCGDVCGIHAIDFAGRGIRMEVQAPFDAAWQESACVSCGACVDVCPTGALSDRVDLEKQVPLCVPATRTTCSLCALACAIDVAATSGRYLATDPAREGGILCAKGRYGWQAWSPSSGRIASPLVRRGRRLVEASWDEALGRIAERLPRGKEEIALVSAGDLTNEEGFLLARLAQEALGTARVQVEALGPVDAPAAVPLASLASLDQADLIVVLGPRSRHEGFVLDLLVREVRSRGAVAASLSGGLAESDVAVSRAPVAAVLAELGRARSEDSEIEALRGRIREAERPVFLFEERALSAEAIPLLAALPKRFKRAKLAALRSHANGAGLRRLRLGRAAGEGRATASALKAALLVAADPARDVSAAELLARLDLVVALSPRENRSTALAHVILPWALPIEGRGHVVDASGAIRTREPAALAPCGRENWEILSALRAALGGGGGYSDWERLSSDAAAAVGEWTDDESALLVVGPGDSRGVEVEEALVQRGIR